MLSLFSLVASRICVDRWFSPGEYRNCGIQIRYIKNLFLSANRHPVQSGRNAAGFLHRGSWLYLRDGFLEVFGTVYSK